MNFVFHRAGFRIFACGGLRSTWFEDWPFGRKAKTLKIRKGGDP
jgi:hypothetical protein